MTPDYERIERLEHELGMCLPDCRYCKRPEERRKEWEMTAEEATERLEQLKRQPMSRAPGYIGSLSGRPVRLA